MEKSKVYFIKDITPENILKIYRQLGINLTGKIGIKFHSGEDGNQNFLTYDYFLPIQQELNASLIECNTAYDGARDTLEKHKELMKKHEWSTHFNVDILDSESPDLELDIPNGKAIKKDFVGNHLANYDGMLVLSHFKGHPMGGFGGALKQLSIGCGSSYGKKYIHGAGKPEGNYWRTKQELFIQAMADAAYAVNNYFKGRVAYINVMKNMSVDCDCCAVAEDPCLKDIGILASLDPVSLDKACIDLIRNSDDKGKAHFLKRVESRKGELILTDSATLGTGSLDYELIEIK